VPSLDGGFGVSSSMFVVWAPARVRESVSARQGKAPCIKFSIDEVDGGAVSAAPEIGGGQRWREADPQPAATEDGMALKENSG